MLVAVPAPSPSPLPAIQQPGERFSVLNGGKSISRHIILADGSVHTTRVRLARRISKTADQNELSAALDFAYLTKKKKGAVPRGRGNAVRVADLFSGCGFMSLGASAACGALGKRFYPVLAVEISETALNVYKSNLRPKRAELTDIRKRINGALGKKQTPIEKQFLRGLGKIDLLVGGPPCQGHSDLNNHTRRSDPKNSLYNRMARFAELVRPKHILIENVPAAIHAKSKVVQKTISRLQKLGYEVDSGLVELSRLGVPQGRRRHLVVASLTRKICIDDTVSRYEKAARSTGWAIADLLDTKSETLFDTASESTAENKERIDYLFKHRTYDLPNSMRPKCHKNGGHSYKSVYGRLRWNRPAQTITTGFSSMGQGRFVHPKKRRTLTPHEAARLQFIPDFFRFVGIESRTAIGEMIGNAVPPKVIYVFALELLR